MTPTAWLASAGFLATAVGFGPARMGFGLFLPLFAETFALSTQEAGRIASLGFLSFLAALLLAAWLGDRTGPRPPVVLGAVAASAGFATVASATNGAALAAGVALAGASPGLCWTPFNDAAERVAPAPARPGALSAVSTGTAVGVAAAGGLFLGVTAGAVDWRHAWSLFVGAGLTAALLAVRGLPGGRPPAIARDGPSLLRRAAVPLHAAALCFGASNAVYLTFAAQHVVAAGGLAAVPDRAASGVIFLAYGLCGVVGLVTGRIEARIGVFALLSAIFAAFAGSLLLLANAPGAWVSVLVSAGLHGAAVMTVSAVLSFWSLRLFPGRGSPGFTVALVGVAAGSVAGPVLAGGLASVTSLRAALVMTAAAPALAMILCAKAAVRHRRRARSPTRPCG